MKPSYLKSYSPFIFCLCFNFFFGQDSLTGFDEATTIKNAVTNGFFGKELKVKIQREKREFIKNKYQLKPTTKHFYSTNKVLFSSCTNSDFELSPAAPITQTNQVAGWMVSGDSNGNYADNCSLQLCCPNAPTKGAIIDCSMYGYVDPSIGSVYPIYSVFGSNTNSGSVNNPQLPFQMKGSKVLRLNNSINDNSVEKLSTTFSITPNNSFIQLAVLCVFATGHGCCDGSMMGINIVDPNTNTVIACSDFSVTSPSFGCTTVTPMPFYDCGTGNPFTGGAAYVFSKWKICSFDLTNYIGQNVTLQVLASDCPYGGHYGYAYLDALCGPSNINVNGNPSVNDTINVTCCQGTTLNATPGFSYYYWMPPYGFSFPGPSTITANYPGTYTLVMTPLGACSSTTRIVNVTFGNPISITASPPVICYGGSATITANGLLNYSWNNGSLTNTTVVSPTVTTTYTVSGDDGFGCFYNGYYTVVVTECTGVKQSALEQDGFKIYPNPNNGDLILLSETQITKGELIIKNVLGQTIHSQVIYEGENKIKLKPVSPGIYYYSIEKNKETIKKGTIKVE